MKIQFYLLLIIFLYTNTFSQDYQGKINDILGIISGGTISATLSICDSLTLGKPIEIKSDFYILPVGPPCIRAYGKTKLDSIRFERWSLSLFKNSFFDDELFRGSVKIDESSKIEINGYFTDSSKLRFDTTYVYYHDYSVFEFRLDSINYKTAISVLKIFWENRTTEEFNKNFKEDYFDLLLNLTRKDVENLSMISKSIIKNKIHYIFTFSYGTSGTSYTVKFDNGEMKLVDISMWII